MKAINFILLLICFVVTACDPADSRLKFVNHRNYPVIVEISNDSSNFRFNNISYYKRNVILKDSVFVFSEEGSHHAMVDYIEHNKDKKLYLVVFSADSIDKTRMDMNNLFIEKKYLQIKGYSEQYLIANNWMTSY